MYIIQRLVVFYGTKSDIRYVKNENVNGNRSVTTYVNGNVCIYGTNVNFFTTNVYY